MNISNISEEQLRFFFSDFYTLLQQYGQPRAPAVGRWVPCTADISVHLVGTED